MCKVGLLVVFGGHIRGSALPGLRQASPTQSLYLEHACTQCVPDVISLKSCILKSLFGPLKQTKNHQIWTNRRRGIIYVS